jgi:tetratricopeptide (TPR) repeat protein
MFASPRRAARITALSALVCLLCAVLLIVTASRPRLMHEERVMESLYHLERQALRDGWTPDLARQVGDLWRDSGDLTRAAAYWTAAGDAALDRLARAYLDLGEWALAVDALERLPADAWVDFQLGAILAAVDPERALPHLAAAQSVYGESLSGVIEGARRGDPLRIGMALAEQGMWAYAELAFERVDAPRAYAYRGYARDQQGKDGGALLDAALTLAPTDPQVRLLYGLHLRTLEAYAASLEAIQAAVALDPENPALYAQLGAAYDLTGDSVSARRWYDYAVSLSGGDPQFQAILEAFDAEQQSLFGAGEFTDEPDNPLTPTAPPVG